MECVGAKAVPPHGLVEELQEYVQAGYIYILVRGNQHKAWGEQSSCRRKLVERNAGAMGAYQQGVSLREPRDKYCLSVHAIRKIICQKQTKGNRSAQLPVFVDLRS